jgi:alpha-galactosidase
MSVRIVIVGGGSAQWVPLLTDDIAITPCLAGGSLVLHDLDGDRLSRTAAYAEHVFALAGSGIRVETTTDLDAALPGADYVIVCISTGALASMACDLEVSARFGRPMPVGDTSGPAGISRALRNVPVLVDIARAMERACPDAWMINVTNPLTALTRAVARETSIRVVGLCHELGGARFFVSQMLDADYAATELRVTGVNHFPLICGVDVGGVDRFAELVAVADGSADLDAPLPMLDHVFSRPVETTGGALSDDMKAPGWNKRRLREFQLLNYDILRRFGALPGADRNHTIEFVPDYINASEWDQQWGIELTTIAERKGREVTYTRRLAERMAVTAPPQHRSTELVVDVIDALTTGEPVAFPMNIPNDDHCPDLPTGRVVESICIADGAGIRGRDRVHAPAALATLLREISAAQEYTVDAALDGSRDTLVQALATDPVSASLDHDTLVVLADAIVDTTARWLPQFA